MPTEPTDKIASADTPLARETSAPVAAPAASTDGPEEIRVRGARVHNRKNIYFTIPHNAITVVTGVW